MAAISRDGWLLLSATPIAVVALSWLLMRTLWLPSVGCWLFYFSTLTALFLVLVTGVVFMGVAALIQHILKDVTQKDLQTYIASGAAVALMFLGKWFLKAKNLKPFQGTMKWFIQHSFRGRVGGGANPGHPHDDPRQLAYRAVFDDAYGGDPYGMVEGWGVKACCKRLKRIKHNS